MRCTLCPRLCGAERTETAGSGFCRMPAGPVVAWAGLHMWEEPCISGTRGSGTVFFSGCTLGCVFCQNHEISAQGVGKPVSVDRLREIFRELIRQGAHNINLVTPGHFAPWVAQALEPSLPVPVVCNTGGYERVETLRLLEGKVQVYLPDMKYALSGPAARYSAAADYPQVARAAILEMYRQTGPFRLDGDGMLQRGVLIRHLILPQQGENTRRVIDWVGQTFAPGQVLFSLMSQYTPVGDLAQWPELQHPVSPALNDAMYEYLMDSPITDGFYQDLDAATDDMIPAFDGTGVSAANPSIQ